MIRTVRVRTVVILTNGCLVLLASCSAGGGSGSFPTTPSSPRSTTAPPIEPCGGLATAAEVRSITGLDVRPGTGPTIDAVRAIGQHAATLSVEVQNFAICGFVDDDGGEAYVYALRFLDEEQAERVFELVGAGAQPRDALTPVTGPEDAALSDGRTALMVLRSNVVLTVLIVGDDPVPPERPSQMRSLAETALPRF
ncbi:hypothetical protein BH20ACT24_BH20ACT24_22610 [soil metagenome]